VAAASINKRVRRAHAVADRWVRRAHVAYGATDAVGRVVGREVVTVLGDSHSRVFYSIRKRRLVPHTWFDIVDVAGATALGLANPNSKTNALQRFRGALRTVPCERKTLVMLGEVDCGFLIWHRSAAKGTSVDQEFELSQQHYQAFLAELLASGRDRLGVVSAILPTVDDYATWEGMSNQRKSVRAGLEERTALTLAYNAELKAWVADHGCAYLDLDGAVLDRGIGTVGDEFRNPDPLDHHLARGPLAELLAREIVQLEWPVAQSR
jgi:hypothetical protein